MFLHRRALYNLMHLAQPQDLDQLENWQKENYRECDENTLFERLQKLGIGIPNLPTFIQLAEEFDSPDDLTEELTRKKEPLEQDKVYLCIFELWRRFLPEKRCPSVFCDELDHQFTQHLRGNLDLQEELQEIIDYFKQILDDHVDEGADPQVVLRSFQTYCAHNLERFLFEYTLNVIESGNLDYAYDLLEGFYSYLSEPIWFDFLIARIAMTQDPEEGTRYLSKLIKKVDSLELAEEILVYLSQTQNHPLFCQLALKTLPLLEKEEELKEFLDMCALHFENMDLKEGRDEFNALIEKRKQINFDSPILKGDADVKCIKKLLDQKNLVTHLTQKTPKRG